MNNKGQTLVVFILLIPLLMLIAAFAIDKGYVVYKNIEIKNVTKDIIRKEILKDSLSDSDIKAIYQKNDIPTTNLIIERGKDSITIKNSYQVDSIFGKIVQIKNYDVGCDITGSLNKNKVVFK